MQTEDPKKDNSNYSDYDLWKYLSDDTAKVKDKLWTIASWLYALMGGLLALIVKYLAEIEILVGGAWLIVMALLGIVLSVYTLYMIREYGRHVQSGWDRTDKLKAKIDGLNQVFDNETEKKESITQIQKPSLRIPEFAQKIGYLAYGYFGVFIFIFAYLIFNTICPVS